VYPALPTSRGLLTVLKHDNTNTEEKAHIDEQRGFRTQDPSFQTVEVTSVIGKTT
jgi:hypothetical protein